MLIQAKMNLHAKSCFHFLASFCVVTLMRKTDIILKAKGFSGGYQAKSPRVHFIYGIRLFIYFKTQY